MIVRSDDYEKMASIWLEASIEAHRFVPASFWHENLDDMRKVHLPQADNYIYADEHTGEAKGFVALREGHIEALFVAPGHQNCGVGRQLLNHTKAMRDTLTVAVYAQNRRATLFYTNNGFVFQDSGKEHSTGEKELYLVWFR